MASTVSSAGSAGSAGSATAPRRRQHDAHSLLRVAIREFQVRGYDGTSMEHIAHAAGITKSSIYHHVSGKEALLGQALDQAAALLDDALSPAQDAQASPLDALCAVIRSTALALMNDVDVVTLFLRVHGNSDTERRALDKRRDFTRRASDLVRAAVASGELRDDLDPQLMMRLIFGAINSVIEWYRPDGKLSKDTIADQIVALTLDGLRAGRTLGHDETSHPTA